VKETPIKKKICPHIFTSYV